jgi:hypothetical protein
MACEEYSTLAQDGPRSKERLEDIRSSRCVSDSDSDRCRENAMDHGYQNVFYHSVAHR